MLGVLTDHTSLINIKDFLKRVAFLDSLFGIAFFHVLFWSVRDTDHGVRPFLIIVSAVNDSRHSAAGTTAVLLLLISFLLYIIYLPAVKRRNVFECKEAIIKVTFL